MKNNIYLIDVTNRDGVQTSRILLSKLAKTMINVYLDDMGIYQSEVGFPTLKHEANYINANLDLAKLVRSRTSISRDGAGPFRKTLSSHSRTVRILNTLISPFPHRTS